MRPLKTIHATQLLRNQLDIVADGRRPCSLELAPALRRVKDLPPQRQLSDTSVP